MKTIFTFLFLCIAVISFSQSTIRTEKITYKNTTVDYIIISRKGEESKKKPLFVFCQGSLARPLKFLADDASYPIFPFSEDVLLEKYHILLVSKPGIPVEEHVNNLNKDYTFPKEALPPKEYILNNNLDYYYKRNNFLVRKLIKEPWIDSKKLVVAGHSEGSYVALKMARTNSNVTHLIYSGGNPLGRMMSLINQSRLNPKEKEQTVNKELSSWRNIVVNKNKRELSDENTSFYTYTLSQDFTKDLLRLKIPVLVTYGTKDQNGIFNDYLNVLTIKEGKKNFTFKSYFNCEHNFFPVDENFEINYEIDNWSEVAKLWREWSSR